jgi:hypothetical protein
MHIKLSSGDKDEPIPRTECCCYHAASCAIHQLPYDAKFVLCTCGEGVGRPRHERFTPDPRVGPEAR